METTVYRRNGTRVLICHREIRVLIIKADCRTTKKSKFVASEPYFNLWGEGKTPNEALRSLEGVLTTYLWGFHRIGRLSKVIDGSWKRETFSSSLQDTQTRLQTN